MKKIILSIMIILGLRGVSLGGSATYTSINTLGVTGYYVDFSNVTPNDFYKSPATKIPLGQIHFKNNGSASGSRALGALNILAIQPSLASIVGKPTIQPTLQIRIQHGPWYYISRGYITIGSAEYYVMHTAPSFEDGLSLLYLKKPGTPKPTPPKPTPPTPTLSPVKGNLTLPNSLTKGKIHTRTLSLKANFNTPGSEGTITY